jgi:uncharacterized protein YcbK (DUF882 family)
MKTMFFYLALLVTVSCSSAAIPSVAREGRFFLMGSGSLHLENLRNNRQALVKLVDDSGAINEDALAKVDWVFGYPTTEKGEHISPRLLFMLSYFSDRVAPGKMIHIESAYRSPAYNDTLRSQGANAARTSTHIDGMALDFWIEGVDGKKLWERVREENCCGVGHYGGKAIHLDAGRPRFWEAATSGTRTTEPDYNRHIYLTTGYDRYLAGEEVRLSLSGISTFDFGIRTTVQLSGVGEPAGDTIQIPLHTAEQKDCLKIDTRKASRFLFTTLPTSLPAGRYRLQLEFCQKPFPQMVDKVFSSEIEVIREAAQLE